MCISPKTADSDNGEELFENFHLFRVFEVFFPDWIDRAVASHVFILKDAYGYCNCENQGSGSTEKPM